MALKWILFDDSIYNLVNFIIDTGSRETRVEEIKPKWSYISNEYCLCVSFDFEHGSRTSLSKLIASQRPQHA